MNITPKEARRESRTISDIGRLIYSASLIKSFDARREILSTADDKQRHLLAEIMVQYEQGLLSPIELTRAIGRLDSRIQLAVTAAQQEEEAARKEEKPNGTVRHQPGSLVIIGKSEEKWVDDGDGIEEDQWETIDPYGERHLRTQNEINSLMDDMHVGYEG